MKIPKKNKAATGLIDYDTYEFSLREWIRYITIGMLLGVVIVFVCYDSYMGWPVVIVTCVIYLKGKRRECMEERKKKLLYHFKDFTDSLGTILNSGYSLENAVGIAGQELKRLYGREDEMVRETAIISKGLRLNKPIEELFENLGTRSGVEDIRFFANLLQVAKKKGGKTGKLIKDTRKTIGEKIDTEKEIDRVVSSKMGELKIMSVMPLCIILYMRLSFGGFIERLYGNLTGACVMSICLGLYIFAFYLGKRTVSIRV